MFFYRNNYISCPMVRKIFFCSEFSVILESSRGETITKRFAFQANVINSYIDWFVAYTLPNLMVIAWKCILWATELLGILDLKHYVLFSYVPRWI